MQKTRFRLIREEDINLDMELYLRERDNGYMPYCIQDILYNPDSPREDKISAFILRSKTVTMFYNENLQKNPQKIANFFQHPSVKYAS